MYWELAGLSESQLTDMLRAEHFAMANTVQTQAERARSVVRINRISAARTSVKREAKHQKWAEWARKVTAKKTTPPTEAAR